MPSTSASAATVAKVYVPIVASVRGGGSGGPGAEELVAEARRLGIDVHELREGEDPGDVARASRAEALGIAGGDGSLAAVAEVARDRDVPFVCIPFGTRNHFARDLGLHRN